VGLVAGHSHHHHHHHRPRAGLSRFARCVANNETGEPGSLNPRSIRWHIENGNGYQGAYQFLPSTWAAAGGTRYSSDAASASPRQQTRIFEGWVRGHQGAWPNTVPPCLGYR
jgi:hypothetical protein